MQNLLHLMPAQFEAVVGDSSRQLLTGDKLDVTVQLEVDADAAQQLLPTWTGRDGATYGYRPLPIGPTAKPVLFVNYTQEKQVDYMAGGHYNEIEFYLSAEFVGERSWDYQGNSYNGVQGMFALLLMPSDLIPLLVGREVLGTPKHLADVRDLVLATMFPGDETQSGWFEAHDKEGSPFIAGSLRNVSAVPYETLNEPTPEIPPLSTEDGWGKADSIEPGFKGLLWKYVAAADWVSRQPDLSYNLAISLDEFAAEELSQPMAGDGNIVFPNDLSAREHSNLAPAFNAIKQLLEEHGSPFPGNTLIRHYTNAYRAEDIHITDGPRLPASQGTDRQTITQ
jgi:hypothetical protein